MSVTGRYLEPHQWSYLLRGERTFFRHLERAQECSETWYGYSVLAYYCSLAEQ